MLHLITGANGAAKTLNTLKWVRERQLKENRPVCYNGRFDMVEGGELASWKKIEFKDWQDEPDGTIFFIDECHNDLPLRSPSSTPPDHVRMLAEHRKRGFDFYLITQHPQNIDSFVRRLIGSPGWHRHLKRVFGMDMVRSIEWAAVNPNCEKDGSGKSGTISTIAFPKEVYGWYKSASLHTGKRRIPMPVWVFLACVVALPLLGWFALRSIEKNLDVPKPQAAASAGASGNSAPPGQTKTGPMTTGEYLDHRKPRIKDFPHTAPAYDQVTAPTVAPYPAACVQMADRCECYTQQATVMQVSMNTCVQIVKRGFFMDWQRPQQVQQAPASAAPQSPQQQAPVARSVPVPAPVAAPPGEISQADLTTAMRLRNPQHSGLPNISAF